MMIDALFHKNCGLLLIDLQKGFGGTPFDAELLHHTTLASLHQEFAQVLSSQQLFGYFDH